MMAGFVALSAAGWLCAQEGDRPPRPPQGGEGREGGPGFGRGQQQFRPMMGMQAQMAATADYVFILRGNTLYKYDVKTLKLEGKAEVEMPMPPRPQEGEGGRRPPQEGGDRRPPPQQ
jgi:hypothetical protein